MEGLVVVELSKSNFDKKLYHSGDLYSEDEVSNFVNSVTNYYDFETVTSYYNQKANTVKYIVWYWD